MNSKDSTDVDRGRPQVTVDARRTRGLRGVRIILGRELSTKLLTRAFLFSTLVFVAMSVFLPLVIGGQDQDQSLRLGYTAEAQPAAAAIDRAGGSGLEVSQVDRVAEGREMVADGEVDALLVPRSGDGGYDVLVDDTLDPQLGAIVQASLQDQSLRDLAEDLGASRGEVDAAASAGALRAVPIDDAESSGGAGSVLMGLAFGAAAAIVVLLWGIPLATDVMQEKVSRVVEILLASVRPWQLLAGKVFATTVIGLVQLSVVVSTTLLGLSLGGTQVSNFGASIFGATTGLVFLVLGVVTCCTLMAGLAARVERQEDLSSVLQPAMGFTLLPVLAAVYGAFEFPNSVWFDIASVAPVFNTFVMPARMAVETVPAWQVIVAIAIAVVTTAAAFAMAGRVYSGAVLRSGGRVGLLEALRSR